MLLFQATSVPEFMSALLVTAPHFTGGRQYFFRGQANADWGLVPSIRRRQSWERFGGASHHGLECDGELVVSAIDDIVRAERLLLNTAKEVILQRGLSPNLVQKDELLAFAQHIGLPTRGLDWTRSPWTAAYFAAVGTQLFSNPNGRLAVFAMSDVYLQNSQSMAEVERLRPSAFGNTTLVSQQGILLALPVERADLLKGVPTTEIAAGTRVSRGRVDDQFVKITLHRGHAGTLVRALRDQDVHAASVFPDARGVAELVREIYLTSPQESSAEISLDDRAHSEAG